MNDSFAPSAALVASLFDPVLSTASRLKSQGPRVEGVLFRHRERADIADLFDLFNEPVFLNNASTHGAFDCARDFEDWLDAIAPAGRYEIVAQAGPQVVAFGGLYAFPDLMNHCGSLLLGVREDWQNQKIGSAIVHILLAAADVMAGLDKIQLTVFTHNAVAVRLYRGFGFEIEGLLRRFSRCGDGFADAYAMALFLDEATPTLRTS